MRDAFLFCVASEDGLEEFGEVGGVEDDVDASLVVFDLALKTEELLHQ